MNSFHPPPALVDRPHQPRSRGKRLTGNGSDGAVYDRSHKCVFPGCHKAFTRSEHLRRHQLNREQSELPRDQTMLMRGRVQMKRLRAGAAPRARLPL
ncbi:hypothetical protein GQ53DRAFT_140521 [Thozetella sp. PMI_491]|nr:hypothetical protein GQ53DRAFT_140521 [Thozetella sp. PMI_491]